MEKLLLTLQTYSLHIPSAMALIQRSLGKQATSLLMFLLSSLLCQWKKHSCIYQRPVLPPGFQMEPSHPIASQNYPSSVLSFLSYLISLKLSSPGAYLSTPRHALAFSITQKQNKMKKSTKNQPTNQKTLLPDHLPPASTPFLLSPLWKNFSKE